MIKYVDEIDLTGKRVFVRADLNVPLDDNLSVADETRLRAVVPTLNLLFEQRAKVILASHLGRPKGKRVNALSLAPVRSALERILERPVAMAPDCIGTDVSTLVAELEPGGICLLENLRFHEGEKSNDAEFARELSELADAYVNDAFATAHRAHASTVGITSYFSIKAAGLTIRRELDYFSRALETPEHPVAAIFGGVKVSTKLAAITNVAKNADKILVGGAMANTFFVAGGHAVGKSLFEKSEIENARACMATLSKVNCELLLPVDVVIAPALEAGAQTSIVAIDQIPETMMALDIGPESIRLFRQALGDTKTIIWNGPMGAFETPEFSSGTFAIVDALAESSALTVVGGGDTDLALHQKNAFDSMSYVSTAGGAFLKLLEGEALPALVALGN